MRGSYDEALERAAEGPDQRIERRMTAQRELCAYEGLPHFAPRDGICWRCGGQVYDRLDGRAHITGCPFCAYSFCD